MSSPDALCSARAALPALTRPSEREVLQSLIPSARLSAEERAQVFTHGVALLEAVRGYEKAGWVERFLQEYRLNTDEGVALLSLAEAYLRVPDSETATALIRDKLLSADWEAHSGKAGSLLVDSATFGLILTQSLVSQEESANVLKKLISRTSEPFVRTAIAAAMRFMGQQFVMGRTIDEALSRAKDKENRAYLYSFDMLGEAARTAADAERYFKAYEEAIQAVGVDADDSASILHRNTVSVKLSALHPRFDVPQADRSVPALIERTRALAILARSAGVGLTIDAEETERLELSLDIIEAVARDPALKGWDGLGMAVQAYQKRARKVIAWADALAGETSRKMTVRLVKGAYWDAEIKRAQERGLADYPVFTRKAATDVSYLACAKDMLACQHLYPAFASHNALTVATLRQWLGDRRDFEFQRLHGMGQGLYEALMEKDGVRCRVYAPVGGHQDLLAYLVRRLLENGANSSFVHQLADKSVPPEVLLADPIETVERAGLAPHPAIPLPQALYGQERQNAKGLDLADAGVLETLANTYEAVWAQPHSAAPLIGGKALSGPSQPVLDPADTRRVVGSVIAATPEQVAQALERASKAQAAWSRRDVEERAVILERLADRLEADTGSLMGLLAREAGKTMADALAEVREAVDFCRYYAVEARRHMTEVRLPGPTGEDNRLRLSGRGVFACISPWNFPLAIFLGQVAAALVTGNAVVAKPAPQTPLIAMRTAQHILEAGVPGDVFHLIPGGPDVGHALVGDPRVTGVAFTGSTATARRIARTLLDDDRRPLVPLIAETGGINAMIVDSTALPEQVVADVITSAFQSAGQRCSALRLLCVQEDVAPRILEMLEGAAQELRLGDPASLRTDIGPVIDQAARDRLRGYVAAHQDQVLFSLPLTADHANGWFVAPHALKVSRIEDVREEVFGPILHVTTWAAGELEDVVHRINASGYGLTMGLHSRLKSAADQVSAQAEVGNLYINRSMIGAVVGVQPFGGEGLSGTGPKAGGPHYLPRFCVERTISIDTTSAGGNASLLSLEDE